jgi:hypothetical protein
MGWYPVAVVILHVGLIIQPLHMQRIFYKICMNTGRLQTHYNYWRHVRNEHTWIAGRRFTHTFHQQKLLISEQLISDTNSLFELANITKLLHAHNNQFLYLPAQETTCIRHTVSTYTFWYRLSITLGILNNVIPTDSYWTMHLQICYHITGWNNEVFYWLF